MPCVGTTVTPIWFWWKRRYWNLGGSRRVDRLLVLNGCNGTWQWRYSYRQRQQGPCCRSNLRLLLLWLPIYQALGAQILPLARGACFLRLSSVVCLPYEFISVNALCIYLMRICTKSQNHHRINRNSSMRVFIVQVYGPDHLMMFCCMVLWIKVTKVAFSWVPIDRR